MRGVAETSLDRGLSPSLVHRSDLIVVRHAVGQPAIAVIGTRDAACAATFAAAGSAAIDIIGTGPRCRLPRQERPFRRRPWRRRFVGAGARMSGTCGMAEDFRRTGTFAPRVDRRDLVVILRAVGSGGIDKARACHPGRQRRGAFAAGRRAAVDVERLRAGRERSTRASPDHWPARPRVGRGIGQRLHRERRIGRKTGQISDLYVVGVHRCRGSGPGRRGPCRYKS